MMTASPSIPKAPRLRFNSFREDWIETLMGELMSFKNGYNAEKEQYGSGIKFINVLDIIENDFIVHDLIIGSVQIPDRDFKKNEVQYGDILFQRSSETREEVGQANVYLDRDKSATFGGFVIRGRPIREFDPVFFNGMLKTAKPRKDITSRSGGSTRYNIGQESLEAVKVSIPTLPEQRKIADFLTAVDGRIGQLSQKKALLEDYKKGVMQQLFTQSLRFKDDHGNDFPEWEEKTLGEVLTIGSGRDYKHLGKGDVPVYGSGGVMTFVDASLYEGESVCIGRKGTIDKPQFLEGAFWTVDTLFYTHSFKGVLPRFIYVVFQQINWKTYNEASGVPSLSKSTIESIPISVPHPDEQTKIANFLTALDRKIESVSQQITHTQAFKKGLLQQMFV
jgi:type I restriction enzyme S subunit